MVLSFNIGKLNISFVFRHKWDKRSREEFYHPFRDYNLGIWYKSSNIVKQGKSLTEKNNTTKSHMIGFNLAVRKFWFTFDYNGKHFEIKK